MSTPEPAVHAMCQIVAIPTGEGFTLVGPFTTRDAAEDWVTTKLAPAVTAPILARVRFTQLYTPEEVEQHMLGRSA